MKIAVSAFVVSFCLATAARAADLLVPQQHPTLQAAVTAAASGDRILMAPGTYAASSVTIADKGLTIEAAISGTVTLQGEGSSMLSVSGSSQEFVMRGLRFRSGAPAISATTTKLSVFDCAFEKNLSGITSTGSTLRVERCVFRDSSGAEYGGGINLGSATAQATIRRCDFVNCDSGHYGGGIYAAGSSANTLIEYCSFLGCSSVYGGGIGTNTTSLTVRRCVFSGNTGNGGGSLWLQGGVPASVIGCAFHENQSTTANGSAVPVFTGNSFCGTQAITGIWTDGGGNSFGLACDSDCDGNGQPDILQRAAAQDTDCNANGVLDSCEAASFLDCDGNGRLDVCDIGDGLRSDCDGDGILDLCELSAGAPDADANGVPDNCDPDCDADGIIDAVEIADGAADCDQDQVPDSCTGTPSILFETGAQRQVLSSGSLSYVSWISGAASTTQPQRWTLQAFALSEGCSGYRIQTIAVNGSLSPASLPTLGWKIWVRRGFEQRPTASDLLAEGTLPTPAPIDDPRSAPANERFRLPIDVTLPPGEYWLTVYGINGSGTGWFSWYANPADGINAPANSMWRSERYPTPGFSSWTSATITQAPGLDPADRWRAAFTLEGTVTVVDCNANGIDDLVEIEKQLATDCDQNLRIDECDPDCDGNGVPDACELAGGAVDNNGNGIPDICECPGDVDLNGVVNGVDLSALLSVWGTSGSLYPRADANRDGIVNATDLAIVLSGWGSCPN